MTNKKSEIGGTLIIAMLVTLILGAVLPVQVSAGTITVPDDYTTIQLAINAANNGDEVFVRSGTYYENLQISKLIRLRGEDRNNTIIDGGGSGSVIYITSNYVVVSEVMVTNGEYGIHLISNWSIHHIVLSNVIMTANSFAGFYAPHSGGYHTIEFCTISNNGRASYAHQFGNSTIRNCEVFGNGGSLSVAWGSNTRIVDNVVHGNAGGIHFDSMNNSFIERNYVYNNGTGISAGYVASYNTIRNNLVLNNTTGIRLSRSGVRNNKVYHNDFIANTSQARNEGFNYWDHGYPDGGNYWSDYGGLDHYSGVNQNEPGSDGIGDLSYDFEGGRDNYPLMKSLHVIGVSVDIQPGSDPNSINPRSNGVIPVAIQTMSISKVDPFEFDATTVDAQTVRFGPNEASIVHEDGHIEDVDADGDMDLMMHFKIKESGIVCGDTEASLTGETFNGMRITGTDEFKTVGCGSPKISVEAENVLPDPKDYILHQNNPNPFNPETDINFFLPTDNNVVITIYNTLGQEICTLVNSQYKAGYHSAKWDGKDKNGQPVSSGIYLYQLRAGDFVQVRKMSLLR